MQNVFPFILVHYQLSLVNKFTKNNEVNCCIYCNVWGKIKWHLGALKSCTELHVDVCEMGTIINVSMKKNGPVYKGAVFSFFFFVTLLENSEIKDQYTIPLLTLHPKDYTF